MSWLLSLAYAHVGATITGVDVEPDPDSDAILLEANFGPLWSDDGATFRWTCHETVTAEGVVLTPRYAVGPEGVWLVTITAMEGIEEAHSLYRSTNGGCSGSPGGLEGVLVSALDWSGERPLAGAGSLEDGAANDLFVSDDAGASWEPAGLELGERVVLSVLGQGDRGWATVADLDSEALSLWRLDETWEEQPLEIAPDGRLQGLSLVAVDGEVVWLALGGLDGDALLRVEGDSVEPVLEIDGDLVDGARTSEGVFWIVEGSRAVHTSTDGRSFEPSPTAPVSIGAGADQAGWLTGYADFVGSLLVEAPDTVRLRPHEIAGPLGCPAGSDHAEVCDPLWTELEPRLAVFAPVDSGDSAVEPASPVHEPEPRHGCATLPVAATWILAALFLRRR